MSEDSNGVVEIYRKHRPRRFSDVIGQDVAVKKIEGLLREGKFPHATLIIGGSGVGKSTLAHILRRKLKCQERDFLKVDCPVVEEPLKTVRDIRNRMGLAPSAGGVCRIYHLEEAQALSRAGFAQQALLDLLENTPSHVYFLLTTTDPGKLIPAIRTRCMEIVLSSLSKVNIEAVIRSGAEKEGIDPPVSEVVLARLVEVSGGSARKALVHLHEISCLKTDEERLSAIQPPEAERQAFDLVKALLWQKPSWEKVRVILSEITEDPEGIRCLVMANARNELLKPKGQHKRAATILNCFRDNFYVCGPAMLALSAYSVIGECE